MKKSKTFSGTVLIGILLTALPFCLVCYRAATSPNDPDGLSTESPFASPGINPIESLAQSHTKTRTSDRPVYPYSVIPGGVKNPQEVKDAMKRDPEVAQHLANFDLRKARVVNVSAAQAVYVSYRKGDKIYWTTKKLTLAKGELLITDGNRTIRGRCGNDVSPTAVNATSQDEPDSDELETPVSLENPPGGLTAIAWDDVSEQPFISYPSYPFASLEPSDPSGPTPPAEGSGPPIFVTPAWGPIPSTPGPPAPPPAVPTPEPASLLLLSLGISAIGLKKMRERIRQGDRKTSHK